MEGLINIHLMWSLESQGLLSEKQCSFRKNHSTLDRLVCFERVIRNTFVKKTKNILTIFFDLDKERLQHNVEVQHLGSWFQGHLLRASCLNILSGLEWVPLLSELHKQEIGVLQDSIENSTSRHLHSTTPGKIQN